MLFKERIVMCLNIIIIVYLNINCSSLIKMGYLIKSLLADLIKVFFLTKSSLFNLIIDG